MDDAFFHESEETVCNLFDDIDSLFLFDRSFFFDKFLQIAIADLLDNVVIIAALHNFIHGHDILGLDLLQNLNLFKQSSLVIRCC